MRLAEESALVVSDDLLSRIDALRGGKAREQFLELAMLLVAELDRVRGEQARLDFLLSVVERLEAQERRIADLMTVQGELLQALQTALNQAPEVAEPVRAAVSVRAASAAYALNAGGLESAVLDAVGGQPAQLWQEGVQAAAVQERQQVPVQEVLVEPLADDEGPGHASSRSIFKRLWLCAALLYGFGDTLLGYLVVNTPGAGRAGLAPFYRFGGLPSFIAGKTVILAGLYALSVFVFSPGRRSSWIVPAAAASVSVYLILHNLFVLIRA